MPAQFFKCLSDPTRLNILMLLVSEQELCVCELTTALNLNQPLISRHLSTLRQCQLLSDTRRGQWVFYRLHDQLSDWQIQVIKTTALAHDLADAQLRLQAMGTSRPARQQNCCAHTSPL